MGSRTRSSSSWDSNLVFQNAFTFSETWRLPSSAAAMYPLSVATISRCEAMNSSGGGEEDDIRVGFAIEITSGSAEGEWRRSMRVVEMDDIAIVAGLREGPGAAEVVCVCERADRDLSKNSRIF